MVITLESIQIGVPKQLGRPDAADPFDRLWTTGIYKAPVFGLVLVRFTGLQGDGQADLEAHGGADKAVCVYPGDHYAEWRRTPELAAMGPGAFGENFTVRGITEEDACIGDLFRAGDLMLQISQPRQPCWKLARKWGTLGRDSSPSGRAICAVPRAGSHDARLRQAQAVHPSHRLRVLQIERERLLRSVGPDETAGEPADGGVVAAGEVAGARPFDLDHACGQVGELPTRERRGDGLLDGDDRDACEWKEGAWRLLRP